MRGGRTLLAQHFILTEAPESMRSFTSQKQGYYEQHHGSKTNTTMIVRRTQRSTGPQQSRSMRFAICDAVAVFPRVPACDTCLEMYWLAVVDSVGTRTLRQWFVTTACHLRRVLADRA